MFRILVMNGLLISMILLWTSAAKEPPSQTLIKSSVRLPTGPLNHSLKETNRGDISGMFSCGCELGGVCVFYKKRCPTLLPSEMPAGKPYCYKKHRCCYSEKTTAAPTTIGQITTTKAEELTTAAPTTIGQITTTKAEDLSWSSITNACIRGNNYKVYEEINIDICIEKCLGEDTISCQSIEYGTELQMCIISDVRSDSDDYVEPCFVDGWVFTEIALNTVPTTDAPTTADPGNSTTIGADCIDKSGETDCEYWAGEGYCEEEQYVEYMTVNCTKTCNKCGADCMDKSGETDCEYWAGKGYCEEEQYVEYMTVNCTKTCNKCVPTTNAPTTTAPSNSTTNVTSCNLEWKYDEDRPLIMIEETSIIIPPVLNKTISDDPNKIPEGILLSFSCPGTSNRFKKFEGNHTLIYGRCIPDDQFQVCFNNYPKYVKLSDLSCSSQISPSIIKQDDDTIYKKSCEDTGGELYRMGFLFGDYGYFKDLGTKICFSEKDYTTLWTSANVNRMQISPSIRDKEVLDKEARLVWNGTACRIHGGQCVSGGWPCPEHLPLQTSQGVPFCNNFYRCCYSDTLRQFKSMPARKEFSKLLRGECAKEVVTVKPDIMCGIVPPARTSQRIINGKEVKGKSTYRWMVGLRYDNIWNLPWKAKEYFCGGSIINANYILTAAHCFYERPKGKTCYENKPSIVHVGIGSNSRKDVPIKRSAKPTDIALNTYNCVTGEYDIAVIKLTTSLVSEINAGTVIPICLAKEDLKKGSAYATGWGSTKAYAADNLKPPKEFPIVLEEVEVYIWPNCEIIFPYVTDNMLCTSAGTCQGDSGGPLSIFTSNQYRQIGIVSFGEGCGDHLVPDVYTRVSKMIDWIELNAGKIYT